jgi:tRNA-splicing ligase RtcB
MTRFTLNKISDYLYEVPQTGGMRVPGRIYANEILMKGEKAEECVVQVANVAHLPGIVKYSIAMPDVHWGYGFPIGGVAAFEMETGIISPGGVGYDINCGVRMMRTDLIYEDVKPKLQELIRNMFYTVPAGLGSSGAIAKLSRKEIEELLVKGAKWAVEKGYGTPEELNYIEDTGRMEESDPSAVSERAYERGFGQVGTLGSGNHFLEVQVIDEIYIPDIAEKMGLHKDGIAVTIHSGSRGLGHQICDDFLKIMMKAVEKYGISLPDRQLACAPLVSPEAKNYIKAMACAANYAWANRQVIGALVKKAFAKTFNKSDSALGIRLIYDIPHNIAKFEEHIVDGKKVNLCVHRKGATRAFPVGHPLIPPAYKEIGQPVLVPGDMGRNSYLCLGTEKAYQETFGSTCHGAGRQHSRTHMLKTLKGRNLFKEMQGRGVIVMAPGQDSVAEEMPEAYKDVSVVVDVMEAAGISKKLVKLRPIGCVKG